VPKCGKLKGMPWGQFANGWQQLANCLTMTGVLIAPLEVRVQLTFVPVHAGLALQGVGGLDKLESMGLDQGLGVCDQLGLQLVGDALVVIGHGDLLVLHPGTGQHDLRERHSSLVNRFKYV